MPNVTVSNTPVTVELYGGESVTVPSGEVWDVTIRVSASDANATQYTWTTGGNEHIADMYQHNASWSQVFKGGETIEAHGSGTNPRISIRGYEVG